ncbi:MAG TPA: hypothetical protein VJY34_14730 [Roseiarcus sp.]|nr:hypothetical protein [Roseiarcus sp.]
MVQFQWLAPNSGFASARRLWRRGDWLRLPPLDARGSKGPKSAALDARGYKALLGSAVAQDGFASG